ncbi:MAG: sigma 54-interacting transcriptional regulator [Polyangiaceae bacterium]|nr:sigma 54-interacting transcriptional regulator [Polyangiaceae bacterium]
MTIPPRLIPHPDATAELTPSHGFEAAVRADLTTRRDGCVERRLEPRLLRPGEAWVVGSRPSVDLRLADTAVSRRHCRIEHHGAALEVLDLESRNGVYVGGARVARARLPLDATFTVGRTTIALQPDTPRAAELLPGMVGASAALGSLGALVRRCAPLRIPALIRGESGSGKELVARALHLCSPRAKAPFVALNAASLAPGLAESELFGHRRGAFTGADADRLGAFRRAHGGTLFLDELGSLPPALQAKLLRVVEEECVVPLGSDKSESFDVRIVTATCEPLEERVAAGHFRADLYERLASCIVCVPPLRERPEDIAPLARHLVRHAELGVASLGVGVVELLARQPWPGNVRELRNVLVQAALLEPGNEITRGAVEAALEARARTRLGTPAGPRRLLSVAEAVALVADTAGNVSAASRRSGVPRSTLRDRLRAAQNEPTTPSPRSVGDRTGTMPKVAGGGESLGVESTK